MSILDIIASRKHDLQAQILMDRLRCRLKWEFVEFRKLPVLGEN